MESILISMSYFLHRNCTVLTVSLVARDYFLLYTSTWIKRITGVVMDFTNWYIPTVLNWRDRLVNTTNPQKDIVKGTTFRMH